jgi:hypothetical protein
MDALVEYYAHALHGARINCTYDPDLASVDRNGYQCEKGDLQRFRTSVEYAWKKHRGDAERLIKSLESLEDTKGNPLEELLAEAKDW